MRHSQTSHKLFEHVKAFAIFLLAFATCTLTLVAMRETSVLYLGVGSLVGGALLGLMSKPRTTARFRALDWRPMASSVGVPDLTSAVASFRRKERFRAGMTGRPNCAKIVAGAYSFTAELLEEAALDTRSDQTLVANWLGGDLGAIDVLVGRYLIPIQSFQYSRVGDWSRSWDLTQETFLRLIRSKENCDPSKPFAVYLFTIARNIRTDWFRSNARFRKLFVSLSDEDGPAGFHGVENTIAVEHEVAKLPKKLREVHELQMQGFSIAEVAGILDLSPRTIVSISGEIRERLRAMLTQPPVVRESGAPHASPESEESH
jgi:RNA polymerase sigma-70 factor (ECF subfamily)